ncbi:MAG: CBS domain-containing protein [Deltaproteobacteria bacterium]|nr:CBS domain-containing protein [Deltaproteobacteria bacterium]
MRVRNIMTSPVITAASDMPVLEAAKLMKEKRIERLPVVEGGKLQGIVTKDRVLRASPSMATSLSLHEIHYLFAKLTVKEIMQRDVITVTPDTTVENAVRLAQEKRVGALPVVEDGHIVGILTTNDFFYLVLNPLLGIGERGTRVIVRHCATPVQMVSALQCVADLGMEILNAAYLPSRRGDEKDLLLHVAEEDVAARLVAKMTAKGLDAEERQR